MNYADQYIPKEIYIADFNSSKETFNVDGFEIPVKLPKMPNRKDIIGYGRPLSQQKFQRLVPPPNLKRWPRHEQDKYVGYIYHVRKNGMWQYIKGQAFYIPGKAMLFFSFWYTQKGPLPTFRMEALEFFYVEMECDRDPNCFGTVILKPRRIGDTEKTTCILWEHASRVRGSFVGMQNVKEKDAQKNFNRIVRANKKMTWFLKPISPSSDTPKKELFFDFPPDIVSRKKLEERSKNIDDDEQLEEYAPIESKIDYESSVEGKYDGDRLSKYHLDESGKVTEFDILSQWAIVKQCLSLDNQATIIGKAFFTTTVEDKKSGDKSSIENIEELWNQSNPLDKGDTGRTVSGLYRYFRSARKSARVDEWGFHLSDEAEKYILSQIKSFMDLGDFERASQTRRQYPLNIEDCFKLPDNECVLMAPLLDRRKHQIKYNLSHKDQKIDDNGNVIRPKAIEGELIWTSGFGSSVTFIPKKGGKWHISQHPTHPNKKHFIDGVSKPGNIGVYGIGVDPIDMMIEGKKDRKAKERNRSNAALVVHRAYDSIIDGHLDLDKNTGMPGKRVAHLMETDQYVCDYLYRPDDPYEFFEDVLKTCIYYGTPMLYESQKPSIQSYFKDRGFYRYVMRRPQHTYTASGVRNTKERGVPASPSVVRQYVDMLKYHVLQRINTFHHTRILDCHRSFNVQNRTERDLTVAAGLALLASSDPVMKKRVNKEINEYWSDPLWETYLIS